MLTHRLALAAPFKQDSFSERFRVCCPGNIAEWIPDLANEQRPVGHLGMTASLPRLPFRASSYRGSKLLC
jgi:hypothetical protein